MGKAAHLTRRFFGSLWPGGPSKARDEWARTHLSDAEVVLWARMSGPDRRHATTAAENIGRLLGDDATRPVVTAALLHDVGKIEAHLGTYGRVVATLSAAAAGRDMANDWVRARGFTRRVGLYVLHPKLGGDHLGMAGSDPLVEAWAREHHLPEEEWSVDVRIGRALKAVDDD